VVKLRRERQLQERRGKAYTRTTRKFSKRRIWIGVGISMAMLSVVLLGVFLLRSTDSPTVLEAVQNPELRQAYIDSKTIDKPFYVGRVLYLDEKRREEFEKEYGVQFSGNASMEVWPDLSEWQLAHAGDIFSDILVYPAVFDLFEPSVMNEEEFENLIAGSFAHEYRHAEQAYKKEVALWSVDDFLLSDGSLNIDLLRMAIEIDAYNVDLAGTVRHSISEVGGQRQLLVFYLGLWDYNDGMSASLIEDLKVEFFADWMLEIVNLQSTVVLYTGRVSDVPNELVLRPQVWDGKEPLYFENLETGRKYLFTKRETARIAERWFKP